MYCEDEEHHLVKMSLHLFLFFSLWTPSLARVLVSDFAF